MMTSYKKICVFCSASEVEKKYMDLAAECGSILGKNGLTLVYGGASSGLMREVSNATHNSGGDVMGVFPNFMHGMEILNNQLDTTIFVDTMAERKTVMIDNADAFIILPGGFGTLDEFFEVLTMNALGRFNKPLILVNHDGFWDNLIMLCNQIIDSGFAKHRAREALQIANSLSEAFDLIGVNV